jgi:hypothetical protein
MGRAGLGDVADSYHAGIEFLALPSLSCYGVCGRGNQELLKGSG